MSFSATVKKELSRIQISTCCAGAEQAGLLFACGSIRREGNISAVAVQTDSPFVVRRLHHLLKVQGEERPQVTWVLRPRLRKGRHFSLVLSQNTSSKILAKGQTVLLMHAPDKVFIRRNCCRRSVLRGAFLGAGTVSATERGYHLEYVLSNAAFADYLLQCLAREKLNPKFMQRKGMYVVYLKDSQQMATLLSLIGAHASRLILEKVRIVKDVRNNINRRVNCDDANMGKTVEASLRQCQAIKAVLAAIPSDKLPTTLKEAAEARLSMPDSSMNELSSTLGISKSALNHRLRRLEQLSTHLP